MPGLDHNSRIILQIIGATRTLDATENIYARQHFVACCKAFGLQAIDLVYIDIKDKEGLKRQCEQGRGLKNLVGERIELDL